MALPLLVPLRFRKAQNNQYYQWFTAFWTLEVYYFGSPFFAPKVHFAAYMISALRLGGYKIYEFLDFYTACFTVYQDENFDGRTVINGHAAVKEKTSKIKNKKKERFSGDYDRLASLKIINEMILRGIEFLPADTEKSEAEKVIIEDGKIRLPLPALANKADGKDELKTEVIF